MTTPRMEALLTELIHDSLDGEPCPECYDEICVLAREARAELAKLLDVVEAARDYMGGEETIQLRNDQLYNVDERDAPLIAALAALDGVASTSVSDDSREEVS
jgi:hypothetical protein